MTEEQSFEVTDAVPAHDQDVAEIFSSMRKALGLSPSALAEKLGTQPSVIIALERGALKQLPDWEETSRIVTTYSAMLHLDCRPILRRIAIRKAEPSDPGDATSERRSSWIGQFSAAQIAITAIFSVLLLALIAAFAFMISNWGGPTSPRPTVKNSSTQQSPSPRKAVPAKGSKKGAITVRQLPLPQVVEAPAAKDRVDQTPANSDKKTTGAP